MDSPLARGAGGVSDEECLKVNPFDWETEFPEIIKPAPAGREQGAGGFDVVIGNPPYVRQEGLGDFKGYFQQRYKVYHGTADLYAYFIEKGVSLLRENGIFSYIVSNKWMRANYGEPLRCWLKQQHIVEMIDFGDLPVFQKATTYPCIIVIRKVSYDGSGLQSEPNIFVQSRTIEPARPAKKSTTTFSVTQVKTLEFDSLENYVKENLYPINFGDLDDKGWSLAREQEHSLLKKLKAVGIPLKDFVNNKNI